MDSLFYFAFFVFDNNVPVSATVSIDFVLKYCINTFSSFWVPLSTTMQVAQPSQRLLVVSPQS